MPPLNGLKVWLGAGFYRYVAPLELAESDPEHRRCGIFVAPDPIEITKRRSYIVTKTLGHRVGFAAPTFGRRRADISAPSRPASSPRARSHLPPGMARSEKDISNELLDVNRQLPVLSNNHHQLSSKPCGEWNSNQFLSLIVERQSTNWHNADSHSH